jgi:hypothetical protein
MKDFGPVALLISRSLIVNRLPVAPLFLVVLFGLASKASFAQPAGDAPTVTTADDDTRLTFSVIFQPRLSYGRSEPGASSGDARIERYGFGLRRARFRMRAAVGRAGAFMQLDGASGTVKLLDYSASYRLGAHVRVRLGRFAVAQPRAMLPTSGAQIDAIDRAAIAERWARSTIGSDGRDFGLDVRYAFGRGELSVALHNGDGNPDRLRGNFREQASAGNATRGVETQGLAVTTAAAFRPMGPNALEVGGFAGFNGSRNPNTRPAGSERGRNYVTYGAHVYWGARPGSRPFRLKFDALGILYEAPSRFEDRQHTLGVALFGAARVHRAAEVFARVERYDPDTNRSGSGDTYVTAGAGLSLSALRGKPYHRERLTLGYSLFSPDGSDAREHLVILQAQLVF